MNEVDPTQSPPTNSPAPTWLSVRMRITLLVVIAVVSFGLIAGAVWLMWRNSDNAAAIDVSQEPKVNILGDGFSPATISIKRGQSITWTSADAATHRLVADDQHNAGVAGFDSEDILSPGDTFTYTFNAAGTYGYHDQQNPLVLKGTVIVQ